MGEDIYKRGNNPRQESKDCSGYQLRAEWRLLESPELKKVVTGNGPWDGQGRGLEERQAGERDQKEMSGVWGDFKDGAIQLAMRDRNTTKIVVGGRSACCCQG